MVLPGRARGADCGVLSSGNQFWTPRLAALLALSILFACAPDPAEQSGSAERQSESRTISIRADLWCPFNCEPQGERQGFMIDVARRALATEEIEVDYALMNWARAIEETRQGKYNAIVGAYQSDAPDFVYPQEELGVSRDVFAVAKESAWHYNGINSLRFIRLGVVHEYGYGKEIDAYVDQNRNDVARIEVVYGDHGLDQNLRKLSLGRIDATVENEMRLRYFLHQHSDLAGKVKMAGSPGQLQRTYIGFSPARADSRELARLLDAGIRRLRASGELQSILRSYGLEDWK